MDEKYNVGTKINPLRVKMRRVHPDAKVPVRGTRESSAYDLSAAINEPVVRLPHNRISISCGWEFEIPYGWEMQVRARSGLASKYGVGVLNSPSTIDPDYRGAVAIILHNVSDEPLTINSGDRLAQITFCPIYNAAFEEVDELSETERGNGGFGSTGVNGTQPLEGEHVIHGHTAITSQTIGNVKTMTLNLSDGDLAELQKLVDGNRQAFEVRRTSDMTYPMGTLKLLASNPNVNWRKLKRVRKRAEKKTR